MSTERRSLVTALALITALSACASPRTPEPPSAPADPPPSGAAPDAPVARIGGQPVTEEDLAEAARGRVAAIEAECADKIYTARAQALDEILQARLISAGAASAGLSPADFLAREVDSKVTAPTDAEIEASYEQVKAQGRPVPPLDTVRDRFAEFLKQQKEAAARNELIGRLRAGSPVEVLLAPPLPPKVEVASIGPSKGPDGAPVTIVEFSDYECPFCVQAEPTVRRVLQEYGDRVRLVYRDFPLPFHGRAQKASEAALCAQDQQKFWEMHEKLFSSQGKLGVEDLHAHAAAIGLDAERFRTCLESGEKASIVAASKADGQKAGVSGTPAFFINGRLISGAQPYERFQQVIEAELSAQGQAKAKGAS